MTLTQHWWSEP